MEKSNKHNLPVFLTPKQLAEDVFQIDYNAKHIAHLRRHSGLPYLRFQINGVRIFRYPREQIMRWITKRTHGAILPASGKYMTKNSADY